MFPRDPLEFIIVASVFGLVLAAWLTGFFMWYGKRAKRAGDLDERMGLTDEERKEGGARVIRLWHEGKETTTEVPGVSRRPSLKQRLQRLVREAGLEEQFRSILLGLLGVGALGFLLLLLAMGNVVPGLALCFSLPLGLLTFVKWRIEERRARFDVQLVDALDVAARSLRAGHPILGAFRLIAEEIPPPVSTVFDEICQQQALGISMGDSLRRVSLETSSADLRIFAASVIIQLESGGDLADMMGRIAFVIRERLRLVRKVRTLTTQTQFSKRILIALPIFMFIILNVVNPKYMSMLYDTFLGQILLGLAAVMMLLGTWMMNRMATLEY